MTATLTIKTNEAKNATRVPNSALRYKPSPPMGPNGKPIPQAPEPPLVKGTGRVYVLTSDKPGDEKTELKLINVGVTDGINTEVTGGLPANAKLVTDETDDPNAKKRKGPF
jgi:HlyD family secretion protein